MRKGDTHATSTTLKTIKRTAERAAFAAPFLLFAAAATASSRWLLLTIRTRRYRTGCIGCRRSRTLRHDPQLYLQLRHTAPVDNHNASGIDAARVDQIILGAICSRLAFSVATAVADDVALRCRLVLQLDREVVESGLLIVDRKSTRLNSSHVSISYAVFCLKKKKKNHYEIGAIRYKSSNNSLV